MGNVDGEEWASAVGSVIGTLAGWVIGYFFVKWWITIDPTHVYGWFQGFLQGGCWVINWIRSWFDAAILVKAPLHTGAYSFWYWVSAIGCSFMWLLMILGFIVNLRKCFQLKVN